ncbi:hypothetical protein H7F33_16865 [Pedobacter sp. PAMC26386]|nr:hypothetical protein H7F33_16865 [Pedobacter sp. PAMC26386]
MKYCQDCGAMLRGRADKKFCDDHCRCHYNNAINKIRDSGFKEINRILKKNTDILEKFSQQGIHQTTQRILSATGFNFSFSTHRLYDKKGETCICCYNYGYITINEEELTILQTTHLLYNKPNQQIPSQILKFE